MNGKKEKIEELKLSINVYQGNKEFSTQCITRAEEEINELEAQIAEEAKPKLDYNKPILTTSDSGKTVILIANCDARSYKTKGYDWLRLDDGKFNSCKLWKTKKDAVEAYTFTGKQPYNSNIFDEIKALQEPLTEFKMHEDKGATTRYSIDLRNTRIREALKILQLTVRNDNNIGTSYNFTIEEFEQFAMNCRRAIATYKRNEATK